MSIPGPVPSQDEEGKENAGSRLSQCWQPAVRPRGQIAAVMKGTQGSLASFHKQSCGTPRASLKSGAPRPPTLQTSCLQSRGSSRPPLCSTPC